MWGEELLDVGKEDGVGFEELGEVSTIGLEVEPSRCLRMRTFRRRSSH